MKALPLLVFFVALLSLGADPGKKAECHHECFSCETRCRHSQDYKSCVNVCLEMKRTCCESSGAGPGPRTTCSCS